MGGARTVPVCLPGVANSPAFTANIPESREPRWFVTRQSPAYQRRPEWPWQAVPVTGASMAVTTPKERRPQRAQSWAFSFIVAALQAESLSVLGRFVSRYTYGRNGLQRLTGPNPTPCLGREFGSFITCIEFRRAAGCRDVPADDGRGVEASHQLVAAKLVAIGFNLLIRSKALSARKRPIRTDRVVKPSRVKRRAVEGRSGKSPHHSMTCPRAQQRPQQPNAGPSCRCASSSKGYGPLTIIGSVQPPTMT